MRDLLPSSDSDPLLRLHDYYFLPCAMMFAQVKKIWQRLEANKRISKAERIRMQRFGQLWLATLYVVVDGFRDKDLMSFYVNIPEKSLDAQVCWSSVHHQANQLGNELRLFRNAVLHFQKDQALLQAKRSAFFEHPGRRHPVTWAHQLQQEMDKFFSLYRVEASVRLLTSTYEAGKVRA